MKRAKVSQALFAKVAANKSQVSFNKKNASTPLDVTVIIQTRTNTRLSTKTQV